jgi:hypothetical protein
MIKSHGNSNSNLALLNLLNEWIIYAIRRDPFGHNCVLRTLYYLRNTDRTLPQQLGTSHCRTRVCAGASVSFSANGSCLLAWVPHILYDCLHPKPHARLAIIPLSRTETFPVLMTWHMISFRNISPG